MQLGCQLSFYLTCKCDTPILSFNSTSEDADAPAFAAAGTLDGVAFVAETILWGPKGAKVPIFKVKEGDQLAQSLSTSSFTRGQRIAIARKCKVVRLSVQERGRPWVTVEAQSSKKS